MGLITKEDLRQAKEMLDTPILRRRVGQMRAELADDNEPEGDVVMSDDAGLWAIMPRDVYEDFRDWNPPLQIKRTLPDWLRIESLGGRFPLQAEGTAGPWKWYFRARHGYWSLSAVKGDEDPCFIETNTDTTFFVERRFERASYMRVDVAEDLIIQELTGLMERDA